MPPVVAFPSRAGKVANRFALRRSSSNVSAASMPYPARYSRTQSISARFDSRLVVSKPINVRISGIAVSCGVTAVAAAGAFMLRLST
jgi:hypothetical protein